MPTLKQLQKMWEVNKDLGFNEENDYGRNLPRQLPPVTFTGKSLGTVQHNGETDKFDFLPLALENEKDSNPT